MSGRKDAFLHIDLTYSLIDLISKQPDFLHEQTLLQYHCALLGVKVVRSPKCHCKIAGKGIEYAWGAAKIWFRMQPLSQRANRESFLKLVDTSLSNDVLAIKQVREFGRCARNFMLAYHSINQKKEEMELNGVTVSESMIKRCVYLMKKKKTHRSAMDFDYAFIKNVLLQSMQLASSGSSL